MEQNKKQSLYLIASFIAPTTKILQYISTLNESPIKDTNETCKAFNSKQIAKGW